MRRLFLGLSVGLAVSILTVSSTLAQPGPGGPSRGPGAERDDGERRGPPSRRQGRPEREADADDRGGRGSLGEGFSAEMRERIEERMRERGPDGPPSRGSGRPDHARDADEHREHGEHSRDGQRSEGRGPRGESPSSEMHQSMMGHGREMRQRGAGGPPWARGNEGPDRERHTSPSDRGSRRPETMKRGPGSREQAHRSAPNMRRGSDRGRQSASHSVPRRGPQAHRGFSSKGHARGPSAHSHRGPSFKSGRSRVSDRNTRGHSRSGKANQSKSRKSKSLGKGGSSKKKSTKAGKGKSGRFSKKPGKKKDSKRKSSKQKRGR